MAIPPFESGLRVSTGDGITIHPFSPFLNIHEYCLCFVRVIESKTRRIESINKIFCHVKQRIIMGWFKMAYIRVKEKGH